MLNVARFPQQFRNGGLCCPNGVETLHFLNNLESKVSFLITELKYFLNHPKEIKKAALHYTTFA
jgi:hypothetical protein